MLVHGKNLFPLSLIEYNLEGYYVDSNGVIYSTRAIKGELRKLNGSRTSSGQYYFIGNGSHRGDHLINRARSHERWETETATLNFAETFSGPSLKSSNTFTSSSRRPTIPSQFRDYASSVDEGIKDRGVVLATAVGDRLVFGTNPKIHTSESSYKAEMERLAKLKPGVKFVALKIISAAVFGDLVWE